MGLFYSEAGKKARAKERGVNITLRQIRPEERELLGCRQCPLDKASLFTPKMPPTGSEKPVLYFLGEAPGVSEDKAGRQFIGASGELIRKSIPEGWEPHIRWNNAVRCHPPGNRDPSGLELACCERLQREDIERTKPQAVVTFGNVPLQLLLGSDRTVTSWRGRRTPVRFGSHTCWLYPIMHPAALLHQRHSKQIDERQKADATAMFFERDLLQMFADVEAGLPKPYVEESPLDGIESLLEFGSDGLARVQRFLEALVESGVEHGIDVETSTKRPYEKHSRLLSIAVGTFDSVLAFPMRHRESQWSKRELDILDEMVEWYLLSSGRKWAHNSAFEQEWFRAIYGPKILYETQWGCTLGQAHILDERRDKGLDDITQLRFGFRVKELSRVDVARLDEFSLTEVLPYNGLDTKWCHAASVVQRDELEEEGLLQCFEERNSEISALVQMEAKGLVRDVAMVQKLDKELADKERQLLERIVAQDSVSQFRRATGSFDPDSTQQLQKFFYDFLKLQPIYRESRSVDAEALESFNHPVAKLLLEFRRAGKNRDYVTPLLPGGKYVHDDGRVHPSYSNFVTVTARLQSDDPNAQNYPRRRSKEVRRAIACPPGDLFAAFDYGQLEARIVAALSRDPVLLGEIAAGQDIHGDWTDAIGGRFAPQKTKRERKKVRDSIKQMWTFALFFGNVLDAVAKDLSHELEVDISPRALAPFFDDFWSRYSGVRRWQDALLKRYEEIGYVETAQGQRRRGPMKVQEAINQPVQGSAAHVVINAQARITERAYREERPELGPVLNVHDDLSFYLPEKSAELMIPEIAREMCVSPFEWLCVPLSVEVSVGPNWCDKEEIATFKTTDFLQ